MRSAEAWRDLSLDGDPVLVVGRRPAAKTLEGFVVELHMDTFGVMRDIADKTIATIAGSEAVEWRPNAEAEEGEQYFAIDADGLPAPRTARRKHPHHDTDDAQEDISSVSPTSDPLLREAAALLRLVLAPGELPSLRPEHLAYGDLRFYAVVWEEGDAGRPVAFVSEYNPVQVLRKASSWFRFDGTLKLSSPPDFTLDDEADLIITSTEIAALRSAAFDRLFSDVRALMNDVPKNVRALQQAFSRLPISSDSVKAIEVVCATRVTFARRLQELASSEHASDVTLAKLRITLKKHGENPADFLGAGRVEITRAEVGPFLDVLEGRWYEADFTSEPRRAARWSLRKSRRVQSP
jgi:hypothetical protein